MAYSFLHPKPKKRLDPESRLMLIFLAVTLLLMAIFIAFLLFRQYTMRQEIDVMQQKITTYRSQSTSYRRQIVRIERLARHYEAIQTKNTLLKESIQNLFDLVPDQITLTKAILRQDGLALYGVTPSKQVYDYLLLAPLRSVFQRNTTTFYPLHNGWWRFVSLNEGSFDTGHEVEE